MRMDTGRWVWQVALSLVSIAVWCRGAEPRVEAGWTLAGGDWVASESRLEQKKYDPQLGAYAFRGAETFSDTVFSARFKVTGQGKNGVGATGFVFRAVDSNHLYYVHFDVRNRQAILVATDAKSSWHDLKRARLLPLKANTWHEGKVEAKGEDIRVYLDGKLVMQAKDKRYPAGAVGFRIGQAQVVIEDIKATGTPAKLAKPWSYTKRDPKSLPFPQLQFQPHQKTICAKTEAGIYEAFPDVCRLANGDLYCVFYAGYGHVSMPNKALPKGGRICSIRSTDNGLTWSKAETAIDLTEDDRDPSVMQLPDGTLLLNFFQGRPILRTFVARSNDNGKTWEPNPVAVDPPPGLDQIYTSARILRLPDGTLLLPIYGRTTGVKNYASAMMRSTDNGKTWGDGVIIKDDRSHGPGHCEPALTRMPDGKLVCHLRPCMCQTTSTDGGLTWTPPVKLSFPGHAADLLLTSKNILLSAHRIPGTSLHYSLDFGKTWSKNVPIDRVGGAYPSMVELPDGKILCIYYEEGAGSSIRATRFQATAKGIVFLPW